ncbi:hypothetical protein B0A49_10130 [Cryomyces minteri]|uniref:BOD1/SHG1 domain-containing protein n=1 Tax=Cryomyces minteri TaxID=331657 RepID=A0A4U0WST2_9PEZI|nr:hypothetical protein B0A49_10130 [Cryomyces minteri]
MAVTNPPSLKRHLEEDGTPVPYKRLKLSDLPLAQAKRSSIDNLMHTFKKKGEFDALRKKTFARFDEGEAKSVLTTALNELADNEIERKPNDFLARDRRVTVPLLEGAAERSDVYKLTEHDVDRYVLDYLEQAEKALRDIRRKEVGDEQAAEEERRGQKSDHEYAADADTRREARAKVRAEQLAKQREKEREAKRERDAQRAKEQKEFEEREALKRHIREEAEKVEKARIAREEKKLAELEAEREAERQKERERLREYEREREERRERRRREEREYEEARERERRDSYREREPMEWPKERSRARSRGLKDSLPPEEEKTLEDAALQLLLREGQELAAKSRPKTELERSESLEPPIRKILPPKSIVPRDPAAARLAKQIDKSSVKPDVKEAKKESSAVLSPKRRESVLSAKNEKVDINEDKEAVERSRKMRAQVDILMVDAQAGTKTTILQLDTMTRNTVLVTKNVTSAPNERPGKNGSARIASARRKRTNVRSLLGNPTPRSGRQAEAPLEQSIGSAKFTPNQETAVAATRAALFASENAADRARHHDAVTTNAPTRLGAVARHASVAQGRSTATYRVLVGASPSTETETERESQTAETGTVRTRTTARENTVTVTRGITLRRLIAMCLVKVAEVAMKTGAGEGNAAQAGVGPLDVTIEAASQTTYLILL